MNNFKTLASVSALLVGMAIGGSAMAAAIPCGNDPSVNYMTSTGVDACLDSGIGNLTGNPENDLFLTGVGSDYELASKSDDDNPFMIVYDGSEWSFSASFWDSYGAGAIGFKFGTGNTPDEWMVYSLTQGATTGIYQFFAVLAPGGDEFRLSHINLYGKPGVSVPEPMTLGLLGLGLLGLVMATRRRRLQ